MEKKHFLPLIFIVLLITGCHSSPGKTAEHIDINVMSFNIRYGTAQDSVNHWNNRKRLVFDVIRQYSPDIIGLQEALRFQIDEIRESIPEYSEIGEGRNGGTKGEYSAILYRSERFDVDESETFWLSNTPEIPSAHWGNACIRICTWGRFIDKQSGSAFYLYNTHLDHQSQPSRVKSVRLIVEFIQKRILPDLFVLTGDFNAGEDNAAIEYLKGKGDVNDLSPIPVVDTFRILYPDECNVGTFNGFQGRSSGAKIDYIFVSPGIKALHASIMRTEQEGRYPSDHFPMTAQLRVKANPKTERSSEK